LLYVDGVVEIARGLSSMVTIASGGNPRGRTLGFTHGLRATLRFIQNFAGEYMREE